MAGCLATSAHYKSRSSVNSNLHYNPRHKTDAFYLQSNQQHDLCCTTSRLYLAYRKIRRWALGAYGGKEGQPFKDIADPNPHRRAFLSTVKDLARSFGTYLSTPIGSLARELRQEGCSAILCQEYEYPRFDVCVLLGKLLRVPVYASFQGEIRLRACLNLFRHSTIHACAGVIIAPQAEIQRVRSRYHVPPQKIARIFNPMDMSTLYPMDRKQARTKLGIPLEAKVVVCHGRIDLYRKGLDILLEAWELICNDRPNTDLRLLLIGSGPDSPKVRQMIADKRLQGVMWHDKFVNDRVEMSRYLSAADVYTLASRQEGFPVAPLEAMTCGLPIVAADAPGVPDILEEGEMSGGIMVPRENPEALALALGRVLDNVEWSRVRKACSPQN